MSANNDDNLFMFNTIKLRKEEAKNVLVQNEVYLFSDNNY